MVQGCSLYLHMTTSGVCKHVTVCITEFTQIVIGRLYYTEVGATAVYSAFAYLWFIILHSISCFWFIALNLTRCGVIKETIIRYFSLRLKFSGLCFFCFFFFTLCCIYVAVFCGMYYCYYWLKLGCHGLFCRCVAVHILQN